jgi:octaprenyl-diphosphate synthase
MKPSPTRTQPLQKAFARFAPLVRKDLGKVRRNLDNLPKTAPPLLKEILEHSVMSPGKLMRPALVILGTQIHAKSTAGTVLVATGMELLHIASLIHDDTVDEADLRRGRSTVAHTWGSQLAVLAGDYIFASAAKFVCDTGSLRLVRRFSETIMDLSSGELMERFLAYNPNQKRGDYEERIFKKTASLFAASAECSALLQNASSKTISALTSYGTNMGMAFQIVDDILDFTGTSDEFGKPVGQDLANGTLTLPSILLLEQYPKQNPIKALFARENVESNLRLALEMVNNANVITISYTIAKHYTDKAIASLTQFPNSLPKEALIEMAEYALSRGS